LYSKPVDIYQRFDDAEMRRCSISADIEMENGKLNQINAVREFRDHLEALPLEESHE